jgi:hypothetical protein
MDAAISVVGLGSTVAFCARCRITIFWPPGPLPLRKDSEMSFSLMTGRGGRGLARVVDEMVNRRSVVLLVSS